ncbi:MAG: hypothetical protein LBS54_03285 [Dysgonamonadaceae bacterium]|jgi:hypothetical protein|nr:hypothetical protein [Dysgonamonadaceae bacterium]
MKRIKQKQKERAGVAGSFRWYSTVMGILLLLISSAGITLADRPKVIISCPDGSKEAVEAYSTLERDGLLQTWGDAEDGMKVFDTDRQAVFKWTGMGWEVEGPVPPNVVIPNADPPIFPPNEDGEIGGEIEVTYTPDGGTQQTVTCTPRPIRFMSYNLGADPNYDTPKKQMAYYASLRHSTEANVDLPGRPAYRDRDLDATVSGGLYQWGRWGHDYAVDVDGTEGLPYRRRSSDWVNYPATVGTAPRSTYPPINDTLFFANNNSWYNGSDFSTLWGGGIDGKQQTVKSKYDPCPTNFRVPTHDEWEQLVNYECSPDNTRTTSLSLSASAVVTETNRGLVWVRVFCPTRYDKCVPTTNFVSGYAIYTKEEWNKSEYNNYKTPNTFNDNGSGAQNQGTGNFTGISTYCLSDDDAPNPLIFLPLAGMRYNDDSKNNAENGYIRTGQVASTWGSGNYWTSTMNGSDKPPYKPSFMEITDKKVNLNTTTEHNARGYSIRCILE